MIMTFRVSIVFETCLRVEGRNCSNSRVMVCSTKYAKQKTETYRQSVTGAIYDITKLTDFNQRANMIEAGSELKIRYRSIFRAE